MKPDKSKEKLLDDLITYTLEQEVSQSIEAMPSEQELHSAYQPSPEFEIKMQQVFEQESKKQRALRRYQIIKRIAACLVVTLGISTVTINYVEAFRIRFYNTVTEVKEKYFSITFEDSKQNGTKEFESQVYMPTYIPEGFVLQEAQYFDNNSTLTYQNTDNVFIFIKQTLIQEGLVLGLDNESALESNMLVKGLDITIYQKQYTENAKETVTTLFWQNDRYFFIISSTLAQEQLIQIATGLKN